VSWIEFVSMVNKGNKEEVLDYVNHTIYRKCGCSVKLQSNEERARCSQCFRIAPNREEEAPTTNNWIPSSRSVSW